MKRQCAAILVASVFGAVSVIRAGVTPKAGNPEPGAPIDASQSAGLFVGVREFTHDRTLTTVKYAVDDAIDLAFLLSVEGTPRLLDPARVVLALSGSPQKRESQERLTRLVNAGAHVRPAGLSDVHALLDDQANTVGANGVLIVSFATHGISAEGAQYLFTGNSILRYRGTMIAETSVRDAVSRANVRRGLILLDACRKRLTADTRAGDADPRSAAALLQALREIDGVVVFSAAAAGDYAYDDDDRRNGVFTAAVMDGLRCKAGRDERGHVTVNTLRTYVEEQVLSWIQKRRDPEARRATQIQFEGKAGNMPLATCGAAQ